MTPPTQLLYHIRRHWEIENRLHWRRDSTLGEDACTVGRGQTPQVLAALNNAILALADPPYRLDPTRFQFKTFGSMLRRSIEHLYGTVITIPMPRLSMKS